MNRYGKRNWFGYVLAALIVIGIISQLGRDPLQWIIPVAVLGGVFLLYKYPPYRWKIIWHSSRSRWSSSFAQAKGGRKTKRAKFRVIPGNKEEDETPKFH